MRQRLLIIGSGEFGLQALHYSQIDGRYVVVGFIDDYREKHILINGIPVLGNIDDIIPLYDAGRFDSMFIAIGYKHLRVKQAIFERFYGKIPFANIIANPIYIDSSAKIGDGVMIYPGCIIDKNVVIGHNVVLNLNALVSHNSFVGNSTFCAPRVTIAGFTQIGSCCFLGAGGCIIDNISIGDDIIIGASSLVISNLEVAGTYVGVPVTFLKSLNTN